MNQRAVLDYLGAWVSALLRLLSSAKFGLSLTQCWSGRNHRSGGVELIVETAKGCDRSEPTKHFFDTLPSPQKATDSGLRFTLLAARSQQPCSHNTGILNLALQSFWQNEARSKTSVGLPKLPKTLKSSTLWISIGLEKSL
jgi:hypothetical protein